MLGYKKIIIPKPEKSITFTLKYYISIIKGFNMSLPYKEIDLSYLESIVDGDKGLIKELIIIFLDQVPEFTNGFSDFYKNRDWKNLAALAHKAKSSVTSMGMNGLGNIDLKNLELIAKSFRIIELKKIKNISDKEQEELQRLTQQFSGLSSEKQTWIKENNNIETIDFIIKKFISTCNIACNELRTVLEN